MTGQLRLEWPARTDLSATSFVASPSSAPAESALSAWRGWPNGAFALIGPSGAGKTHLAHIWADAAGARAVGPGDSPPGQGVALYEDADRNLDDELAFSLINNAMNGGMEAVLFTARTRPVTWPSRLPDLDSRLRALSFVEIEAPGEAELAQILSKLLRDRHVRPRQRLIDYLLRRMERSPGGARDLVERLDHAAAARGERINLALARDYFSDGEKTDAE